jgi:hypothetical protein
VFAADSNKQDGSAVWQVCTQGQGFIIDARICPAVLCGRYLRNVNVFAADASKNYTSVMCEILYAKLPLSLFHA